MTLKDEIPMKKKSIWNSPKKLVDFIDSKDYETIWRTCTHSALLEDDDDHDVSLVHSS